MPSIGLGRNLIHQFGKDYNNEERCDCCPYGYHIDLDFVPFTKKMLSREGDFERLKELKDKWRSERQSMDKLLGVENVAPKIWDVNATISRATTDIWKSVKNAWADFDGKSDQQKQKEVGTGGSVGGSTELIFENGLSEAVTDFEEALLRTRPQSKILSYEIPDSQKFHTFPRIKAPVLRDPVTGASNFAVSSIFSIKGSSSTTSTVSTVIMRDSSAKSLSREINKKSADSLSGMDGEGGESIYSRTVRQRSEDSNRGLGDRITDLEDQVKMIPELEVKLTLLKEEKRQLMKLLEVERQKYTTLENNLLNDSNGNQTVDKGKRAVLHNGAPAVPPRRKTRDASVGRTILTRDVGVSHIMPRTRSIGIGGSLEFSTWDRSIRADSISPTGSSSGTLKRRVKTFEVGVQVKDYDLTDSDTPRVPVLQIVEGVEFGVQVGSGLGESSPEKPREPRKKHSGMQAKPTTSDVGTFHKPSLRDIGIGAVEAESPKEAKVRVKHVGTSASLSSENVPKEIPALKVNRAVAVNTDKLRTNTIGCNTSEIKSAKPALKSSSTQTRVAVTDVEPASLNMKSESPETDKKDLSQNVKGSLSLPLSVPTIRPTAPSLSSGEVKGLSKIPRFSSPTISPIVSPRGAARKIPSGGFSFERTESPTSPVPSPSGDYSQCPAESLGSSNSASFLKKPTYQRTDTYTKEMYLPDRQVVGTLEPLEEEDREGPRSSSASSSSGFAPIPERREKAVPSKEMQAALKVLNDALLRGKTTQQVTNAISIILHEWFRIAGTKTANPFEVEDYLDSFEIYSPQLLRYIVNMPDGNGNTALHYAVSHGNFDVVSILLDSKVCDPNKANKAGYTSIMLVALAKISCEAHRQVVRRLFSSGDVNIKAAQHGQTALMLGASHGRFDTIRLLLEAGADINIPDEDGSTALMCAAEHGHLKIVKYLLGHPDCDPHITDHDGSTAFSIAMEGGFKDIGVLLYAQMHFGKAGESSAGGIWPHKSRSTTPSSQNSTASSSAHTSPLAAKRQHSDSSLFSSNKEK